ncbi:MAG: hypothetical protein WCC94_03120 [Candidatus Bathyarchaeia archaeon]
MARSGSIFRFIAILAAVLLLGILFVSPFKESFGWSTSTQAGTGVFVATRTFVFTTTDQYGNLVTSTMTSTYLTTSQTTSGTATACAVGSILVNGNCVKPGQAYLTLTLTGTTVLLDKDGNALSTRTIEIVPATGGAAASKYGFTLDATVAGVGIQWDTLQVIVSLGGVVGQPSLTDPNKADIVNDAGIVKHVTSNQKTSHVTGDITIDQLLGGKSWDHGRYLMPALGVVATATAKIAPGYTYELAGTPTDTVGIITSPVVSLASLKWYQPPTPTPTQTGVMTAAQTTVRTEGRETTETTQRATETTERATETTERTTEAPEATKPPVATFGPFTANVVTVPALLPVSTVTKAVVVEEAAKTVREIAIREATTKEPTVKFPDKPLPAEKKVIKVVNKIGGTGATYMEQLLGAPTLIEIWSEVGSNIQLGSSGRLPMLLISITLMVVAVVWVLSDRNAKKRFKHLSGWFSNI